MAKRKKGVIELEATKIEKGLNKTGEKVAKGLDKTAEKAGKSVEKFFGLGKF